MDTKDVKNQRLSLIAKWRNNGRRSTSRERSSSPKFLEATVKKKLRKSNPDRECLAAIVLEPEVNVSSKPSRKRSKSNATAPKFVSSILTQTNQFPVNIFSRVQAQNDEKENTSCHINAKIQTEMENPSSPLPEPVNNNTKFDATDTTSLIFPTIIVLEEKTEDAVGGKPEHIEEKDKADPVMDDYLNLPLKVGDIVWAYISGYPLWPAMITYDPLENLFIKSQCKLYLLMLLLLARLHGSSSFSKWKEWN